MITVQVNGKTIYQTKDNSKQALQVGKDVLNWKSKEARKNGIS